MLIKKLSGWRGAKVCGQAVIGRLINLFTSVRFYVFLAVVRVTQGQPMAVYWNLPYGTTGLAVRS